ncbi:MAG: SDR family oxidoreductase [Caldilineaceae bacterium]|nr:SDR family oxidoreductase [Caldilineaceae bacterium]
MARQSTTEETRNQTPKTVLITGASSGIGRACALRMDRAGWQVFATVRKDSDANRLQSETTARLQTVQLDVTDADQVKETARAVAEAVGANGLHGLINNAGIAGGGLLEFLDPADFRQVLETNTIAPLTVTQSLIPLLRKAQGRILMVSSEAGFSSTPLLSPYSASKFALEALTDGMRLELRPWGIDVVSVQPGAIDTDIWEKARYYAEKTLQKYPPGAFEMYGPLLEMMTESLERPRGVDPDKVAKTVQTILSVPRPKARYLVGRDAVFRRWLERLPTALRDKIILSKMPKYGTAAIPKSDRRQAYSEEC